jgi:hypothetical protein
VATTTKAELEATVKRLQKSMDRAKTQNIALSRALDEAREREKATAEILHLIRRSPADTRSRSSTESPVRR